jgi:uroporphyrinogen-III synthase
MGMAKQRAPVPVLLTRPLAQSQAFAAQVLARFGAGVRPVLSPLMAVQPLSPALPPGPFAGVIFTSAAGVEAALSLCDRLPRLAWCVGQATADRAAQAGFQAQSAGGDADALVAAILADPPPGRLLHLRGEDTRGDVAERLVSAGLETVSQIIYRQIAQPLTPEGRALLATPGPVILPLFSPRSARLVHPAAPDIAADLALVAMSVAVAEAAQAIPHRTLHIAARPEAGAMLNAIALSLGDISPP